jgi:hypothetical protein
VITHHGRFGAEHHNMHLNGWQRIGIVASVCWAIVGGLWVNSLVIDNLGASVSAELTSCLHNPEMDWGSCNRKFKADWPAAVADHWYWAALYTLVPIPIVWLIVYGLVGLVRWIVAGFRPRPG